MLCQLFAQHAMQAFLQWRQGCCNCSYQSQGWSSTSKNSIQNASRHIQSPLLQMALKLAHHCHATCRCSIRPVRRLCCASKDTAASANTKVLLEAHVQCC